MLPVPSLQLPLDARLASIAPGWQPVVRRFLESDQGRALQVFLAERAASGAVIYPPQPFHALELTDLADTRVVILGQDPYHGPGQAHGLAFSVPDGARVPPSLRNIFLELRDDLGCPPPAQGNLERWARQGVLLLNAVMSVEDGKPASHAGKGWERLTDLLLAHLAQDARPKVFLLWGAYAQAKRAAILAAVTQVASALAGARTGAAGSADVGPEENLVEDGGLGSHDPQIAQGASRAEARGPHLVLTANHPSPLSARRPPASFIGCRHFSRVNAFLRESGCVPIDWCT